LISIRKHSNVDLDIISSNHEYSIIYCVGHEGIMLFR